MQDRGRTCWQTGVLVMTTLKPLFMECVTEIITSTLAVQRCPQAKRSLYCVTN